jgi:hypothetical protein
MQQAKNDELGLPNMATSAVVYQVAVCKQAKHGLD